MFTRHWMYRGEYPYNPDWMPGKYTDQQVEFFSALSARARLMLTLILAILTVSVLFAAATVQPSPTLADKTGSGAGRISLTIAVPKGDQ